MWLLVEPVAEKYTWMTQMHCTGYPEHIMCQLQAQLILLATTPGCVSLFSRLLPKVSNCAIQARLTSILNVPMQCMTWEGPVACPVTLCAVVVAVAIRLDLEMY